jgi:hypothetical protein
MIFPGPKNHTKRGPPVLIYQLFFKHFVRMVELLIGPPFCVCNYLPFFRKYEVAFNMPTNYYPYLKPKNCS